MNILTIITTILEGLLMIWFGLINFIILKDKSNRKDIAMLLIFTIPFSIILLSLITHILQLVL